MSSARLPAPIALLLIGTVSACYTPLFEGTYLVENVSAEADGCSDADEEWGVGEIVEWDLSWNDYQTLTAHSFEEDVDMELEYDGSDTLLWEGTGIVTFTEGCYVDTRIQWKWEIETASSFSGKWQFDMEGSDEPECGGHIETSGCDATLFQDGTLDE